MAVQNQRTPNSAVHSGIGYQVIYDKHGFILDPVFVDTHFYQTWINPKRLEVIGNSYTKGEGKDEREKTDNVFKRI